MRTVFRNIFGSNEPRENNQSVNQRNSKQSFSRRMKTRLSRYWKKDQSSNDEQLNDGNFDLSSILKGKKKSKNMFSKQKFKFVDEVEVPLKSNSTNMTELKIPTDSDIAYYKKMKEELLERSKDLVKNKNLKRKASSVSIANFDKSDNPKKRPNLSKIEEDPTAETWTKGLKDPIEPARNFEETVATLKRCPLFYGSFENTYSSMSSVESNSDFKLYDHKKYRTKKTRNNRYNPMSRSDLSFSDKEASKMSWCS